MSGWDQQYDREEFERELARDGFAIRKLVFPPVRAWGVAFCNVCFWRIEPTAWLGLDETVELSEAYAIWQDAHDEHGACKCALSWREYGRETTEGGEHGDPQDSGQEGGSPQEGGGPEGSDPREGAGGCGVSSAGRSEQGSRRHWWQRLRRPRPTVRP